MPQQEVSQVTSDSSSSRPEVMEGAEQRGESRSLISTSLHPEALFALLNAANADYHDAPEGTQLSDGGVHDATSLALETVREHGITALERPGNLDGELANIGPSHTAIVLSPADSTSALEHLSTAMDELLVGHPSQADVAPLEQSRTTEHRSNIAMRIPALRQRSRSNVETQTSGQAQPQGQTLPQRPSRDEFAFYLNLMDPRRPSSWSRYDLQQEDSSSDVASTTLGRRVAARATLAQGQADNNDEQRTRTRRVARIQHPGRSSITYFRNAIGMSIGNVNENGLRTTSTRPIAIEEDSDLPRLLDGLQSSEDEANGGGSSDTENEELRLRFLELASADNALASLTDNTSGSTLRDMHNGRTRSLVSASGRSTPELIWPPETPPRELNANARLVPQSTVTSRSTNHTASQTEDVLFPRSPSPSVFDEGIRTRSRAGPFREVVETVQSLRGSYQIRRHVNARGEEQVHQIRAADSMWDDFESSFYEPPGASLTRRPSAVDRRLSSETWESILRNRERVRVRNAERVNSNQNAYARARATVQFPPTIPRELVSAPGMQASLASARPSASSSTSSSSSGATRRRGWARLNADGDEIPTDEEEEVERIRTEQRLRSGDTVFPVPATSANAMRTRLEYLAPTTRSIFTYGLEDEDATPPNSNMSARVRLNIPVTQAHRRVQQLASEAVVTKSEKNSDTSRSEGRAFGTDVPYRLSPLPNSLPRFASNATAYSATPERRFVARQSEFAAR